MRSDKEPLTDRNEAHARSTIYKWVQLVVGTSAACGSPHNGCSGASSVKEGVRLYCIFLDRIVLRSSSIKLPRVLFRKFVAVLLVGSCFDARNAGKKK